MSSRGVIALAIAAGLIAPLAFHGETSHEKTGAPQAGQRADSPVDLRVDTTLVLVSVGVSDALNRPISGLKKENFHVFDNKVEQKIVSFGMEDDPIAVGLVFDVSGSMARDLRKTQQAASRFFDTANPDDEFCMVELASEAKLVVPLTTNTGEIENQLRLTKSGGSTALLDGVHLALDEMRKSRKPKKALVIISDGGDNHSRYTETEVKNAIRESNTVIYAIGVFGNGRIAGYHRQVLRSMTEESGGQLFPAGDAPVADFAGKILTDLRNRYVLGYSPTNSARDGSYHRLEVKLVSPPGFARLSVHWKTGYYATTE